MQELSPTMASIFSPNMPTFKLKAFEKKEEPSYTNFKQEVDVEVGLSKRNN
jgi:hypothetical protein